MAKSITTILDRKLWLTAAQDALVEDGDKKAAFLYGAKGHIRLTAECKKLGYKPLKKKGKEAEPVENKEAEVDEDKAADDADADAKREASNAKRRTQRAAAKKKAGK